MQRMKHLGRVFALATICLASTAWADQVRVPHTSVVFESPKDFTQLSVAEIGAKFPPGGPGFAVGNERRTTTIAYDFKPVAITDNDVAGILDGLASQLESSIPGLKWVEKKVIQLDGHPCLYLEMTSSAKNANIHNIMLITPQESGLLMLNFNSTLDEFPKVEPVLRTAIASIRRSAQ